MVYSDSIISIAGFNTCPFYIEALKLANNLASNGLIKKVDNYNFFSNYQFKEWLNTKGHNLFKSNNKAQTHTTCPFIWVKSKTNELSFIGGYDDFTEWINNVEDSEDSEDSQDNEDRLDDTSNTNELNKNDNYLLYDFKNKLYETYSQFFKN